MLGDLVRAHFPRAFLVVASEVARLRARVASEMLVASSEEPHIGADDATNVQFADAIIKVAGWNWRQSVAELIRAASAEIGINRREEVYV